MANKIVIKRSTTGGNVPTLDAGELAVNLVDKRFFTANATTVFDAIQNTVSDFAISNNGAGALRVGNSTVNAVANSTTLKLSNSTVNTVLTIPTSAQYSATNYFLHANGSWVTVTSGGTPGGANTYVQYNDSGAFNGTAGFTYDESTNNVTIANTLTVASLVITTDFTMNTDTMSIGNSTINTVVNSTFIKISNSTVTTNLSLQTFTLASAILANTTAFVPASNTYLLGNTTGRWVITANSIDTTGLTGNSTMATATALNVTNQTNTATLFVTTSANIASSNVIANTQGVFVANTTGVVNAFSVKTAGILANTTALVPTSNTILLGNTIGRWVITANSVATQAIEANATALNPTSNAIAFGNTIGRWVITANSVATQGVSANATTLVPTSNSILLGNTIGRWVISANTLDLTGVLTSTANVTTTGNVNGAIGYFTGLVNAANFTTTGATNTATFNATTTANVGANVQLSTSQLHVGTTTVNAVVNSTAVRISSNSTTFSNLTEGSLVLANTVSNTTISVPTTTARAGNYYLKADGTWTEITHVASGSDTQVQFNDGGTNANGSAGFTFTKASNNVFIGNTLTVGSTTVVNTTHIQMTTGFQANTTALNPTSNAIAFGNTIGRWVITANSVATQGVSANATTLVPTANTILLGNTIGRWVISANTLDLTGVITSTANVTTTGNVNGVIGYFTGLVNAANFTTTGTVNTATFNATTTANVGANVQLSTSQLHVGTTTVNAVVNSTSLKISSNSTTFATLTQGSLVLANTVSNTTIAVPSTTERAGSYYLKADGTWSLVSAAPGGSDTHVLFNDGGSVSNGSAGFTFTKSTNNVTIANTLTVGSTTVVNTTHIQMATGFQANTTALNPTANTILLGNTIGRWVITANSITTTGLTGNATMGTATAFNVTNQTNTATLFVTTSANIASSNVIANTQGLFIANTTGVVNAFSLKTAGVLANTTALVPTSNTILLGNTIGRWVISANTLDLTGVLTSTANVTTSGNVNGAIGNFTSITSTSFTINTTSVSSLTFATIGTTPQEADSWLKASYRSCEYYISVKDDAANAYLSTKLNVLHAGDAANVFYTEYGKLWSNTEIATFSANANTTHVRFWVTPTPANTTVNIYRTIIAV